MMYLYPRWLILAVVLSLPAVFGDFDPYTGEETLVDQYEDGYSEGYEYYYEGESSDPDDVTPARVVEMPPGYLVPKVPAEPNVFIPLLNKKFISDVSEVFQCVRQEEITTSNQNKPKEPVEPTVEDVKDPDRKLSFREIQEEKVRIAREKMKEESVILRHRLGSGCERSICGACRIVVEEFAEKVVANIGNSSVQYVADLADELFCDSKEVSAKYKPIVHHICNQLINATMGYKAALIQPFEEDVDWFHVNSVTSKHAKKRKVCLTAGACDPEHFEIQLQPLIKQQEHWDDRCYVCQAVAKDLEERVGLMAKVTESNAVSITAETCDRMRLEEKYDAICRGLISGKLIDDIAWLAKIHGEKIERKVVSNMLFADSLCEEIKYCTKWIDPIDIEIQEEVVPVFF